MVISLISLEKSLPRCWSLAPFLRLMVAHLEWPDMMAPRDQALASASFSAFAAAMTRSA